MKKFFQFAMVAAAALAFVACGNNAAAPEAETATEEVAVVEGTEACCEHGDACDSTKAGVAVAEAAVEATEEAAE